MQPWWAVIHKVLLVLLVLGDYQDSETSYYLADLPVCFSGIYLFNVPVDGDDKN